MSGKINYIRSHNYSQVVKMNRLEKIAKSQELEGIRVVITGCGYKPVQHIFYDIVTGEPSHDSIIVNEKEMKLNIGAATAGVLALAGATVHMVSTSMDKLQNIKESLDALVGTEEKIECSQVDLFDERSIKESVDDLPEDKPLYWVQALGLSGGAYKVKDDNPYLPLEDIDPQLMEAELSVTIATQKMMRELLPRLNRQKESRIAIITSMSAIRAYSLGGTHCAAKAALDKWANSARLALYKQPQNIFITTIRPGGVDTGLYDNIVVQNAINKVSEEYSGQYKEHQTYMPPTSVGEVIKIAFTVPAHIPSLNVVAKGQFPHEGS